MRENRRRIIVVSDMKENIKQTVSGYFTLHVSAEQQVSIP